MPTLQTSPSIEHDRVYLDEMLTTQWSSAREERERIAAALLRLAGFPTLTAFLQEVAPKTTVFSVVGGAATRWDTSFDDPVGATIAQQYGITRGKSRFLAPVPNMLPENEDRKPFVPILAYNLHGVKNLLLTETKEPLGNHVLIYGRENETEEIRSITDAAGITQTQLRKQEIRPGKVKPFGHADALLQHIDTFSDSQYVLTHFGGDVTSPLTVEISLLCLHVLTTTNASIDLILPTARMEVPKYPVFIDADGLPRQFGQEKLMGKSSLHPQEAALTPGGSNIGIRVYLASALRDALQTLNAVYSQGEEFALDHVDQHLANQGKVRQLCIALPEEISHAAKTLTELPAFLDNERLILEDQKNFRA